MQFNTHTVITQLENNTYPFKVMEKQMLELVKKYPFLTLERIGWSLLGRPLYTLKLGKGPRKIHVNGSHHANEWITSIIIMKSIEIICELVEHKMRQSGDCIEKLLSAATFDFVPMVNPDGVELCTNNSLKDYDMTRLIKLNEGQSDFSKWKANIRGVDLNRNYDAGFEDYKKITEKKEPSYAYYQGMYPESEPETKAIAQLTRKQNYDMVFAYHTQGEVIYWTYQDIYIAEAEKYAKMFSKTSGYDLDVPGPEAASGGYKDWFILHFKKPGFTIECGYGENPIDIRQVDTIVVKTLPILLMSSDML